MYGLGKLAACLFCMISFYCLMIIKQIKDYKIFFVLTHRKYLYQLQLVPFHELLQNTQHPQLQPSFLSLQHFETQGKE